MNNKYISGKEFESLSETDQIQVLKHMLKDIPHDDLRMLKDTFCEIEKIQEKLRNMK